MKMDWVGGRKGVGTNDNSLREPESVLRPYGDEPRSVVPKRMQEHVVNALQLRGAADQDIKLCKRAGHKQVCTVRGEVRCND